MGLSYSFLRQTFPLEKTKFTIDDIPDLNGKVAIVTGGSTGIGKETVKGLLLHNAKVYILTRNKEKTEHAIAELKDLTGHEAQFVSCDLADLVSVKHAAEEFTSKEKELYILINNAGVLNPPIEQLTAQGYDLQLGTNALGHFYLTKLLLPTLLSTVNHSGHKVRVVNVSSVGHLFGTLDFDTFRDTPARRKLTPSAGYGQSKFANIVLAAEFTRRYSDQGIVTTSAHPGAIISEIFRHWHPVTAGIMGLFLSPPSMGALTPLYAATSPETENLGGKYFVPWARLGEPLKATQDPKLGQDFWEWCEEQVKDI
ncbi:hypothetical protein M378DRAFT_164518 [Amanita muscaria Koide BX008]|uniref:NAD(P)-binding protein n=1 Tax=Amanita muscaria (strain Koide BX008) TaxID=946122 RepID=A0A0C2SJS5_AMAMK|nr:hypothetical protein M378DRAFT_164518 [Amanita muscaria Koide BX008]